MSTKLTSIWTIPFSLLLLAAIFTVSLYDVYYYFNWQPDAVEDRDNFLNLTRRDHVWDVAWRSSEPCGALDCFVTRAYPSSEFDRQLIQPAPLGTEPTVASDVMYLRTTFTLPPQIDQHHLGLYFRTLFAKSYRYYVNDQLVASGPAPMRDALSIPAALVGKNRRITVAFALDTTGFGAPGFASSTDVLVGNIYALRSIRRDQKNADDRVTLWLMIPSLVVALLFCFGSLTVRHSFEFLLLTLFGAVSAAKHIVFAQNELTQEWLGLDRWVLVHFLDVLTSFTLICFLFLFFRRRRRAAYTATAWSFLACTGLYAAVTWLGSDSTAFIFGRYFTMATKLAAAFVGIYLARQAYHALRHSGRSAARQNISLTLLVTLLVMAPVFIMGYTFADQYWLYAGIFDLVFLGTLGSCVATDMGAVRSDRDNIRQKLGAFVDEQIVDAIVSDDLDPVRIDKAAVLFIDIRGFTALVSRMHADRVRDLLNAYYQIVVDSVYQHGGMIDKFMGDGVLAVWGAPKPCDNPGRKAMQAALEIRRLLAAYNAEQPADQEPVQVGIGIHCGPLLAAVIGAQSRYEYSVLGEAVNKAQRFEAATKDLGRDIIISEEVLAGNEELTAVVDCGRQSLKGFGDKVACFGLMGLKDIDTGEFVTHEPIYDAIGLGVSKLVYGSSEVPTNLKVDKALFKRLA